MIFRMLAMAVMMGVTSSVTLVGVFCTLTMSPLYVIPTVLFVIAATELYARLLSWYTDDL